MSSISPKQRPSGQNLSVQFNRSGGSDGEKARINVEKNGSHDYLHPLNDIHKFNKVVSQVSQHEDPLSPRQAVKLSDRKSWGSTLPPQYRNNLHQ